MSDNVSIHARLILYLYIYFPSMPFKFNSGKVPMKRNSRIRKILIGLIFSIFFISTVTVFAAGNSVSFTPLPRTSIGISGVGLDKEGNGDRRKDFYGDAHAKASQHEASYIGKSRFGYNTLFQEHMLLQQRVIDLERMIARLQGAIYALDEAISVGRGHYVATNSHSCLMKTNLHGSFFGQGATRLEAKAHASMACEAGAGEFWCSDELIECDAQF